MIVFALIFIITVQSCSNDDENNNTANVQFKLVDAPGDYDKVNVEIVDIQYNSSDAEEGWKSFKSFSGPITVDLTELIAGNSLLLTDEIIPAGMLKQVRLILGDNNTLVVEEDGGSSSSLPLDTPSAQQSGLKLNLNTELEAGFSYTFILDWDVQKSVVEAGNTGKYNLKPVIKVNAEVNSGSIRGRVIQMVEGEEVVLEGVVVMLSNNLEERNTETNVDGDFLFQGLDEGGADTSYILKIEKEGYQPYELTGINVNVGNTTDVGTIELLVVE